VAVDGGPNELEPGVETKTKKSKKRAKDGAEQEPPER